MYFAFALFYSVLSVEAQTDTVTDKKMHRVEVSVMGKPGLQKGILFEIEGNTVIISSSSSKKDYYSGYYTLTRIDVSSINSIKLFKGISIKKMPVHGQSRNFNKYRKELNECSFYSKSLVIRPYFFRKLGEMAADTDGNTYFTISLGGQLWLAGNLKVTHYRNGDVIPLIKGNAEWEHATAGATCRYINGSAEKISEGRVYNWYAVSDKRGLCPKGWHVPNLTEWTAMIACLGGESSAASRLTENIPANADQSGKANYDNSPFALPCGFRYSNGEFSTGNPLTYQWWMATPQDSASAKSVQLGNENSGIFFTGSGKASGLPVRCIKD